MLIENKFIYKNFESVENFNTSRIEKPPSYIFAITRRAKRLPSGEISLEGRESAKMKGGLFKENVEVIKGYDSDEKSKRTYITGDLISSESGIKSPVTKKIYATRKVEDIQYGILSSNLKGLLSQATDKINEATLREIGESVERDKDGKLKVDLAKLPDQEKIASIRAKNQIIGFRYILEKDEAIIRMAMGLAHQLNKEFKIAVRYDKYRKKKGKKLKKNAVFNTIIHGMFTEALLKKTGVLVKENGEEAPISNFENDEFGGYINTNESIYLKIKDLNNIPDEIPVIFKGRHRPKEGKILIDRDKFFELDSQYKRWKH